MTPIAIDVETFWSTTHSLSKMSPILYCLHPDTELISLAFKIGEKPTECIFGEADMRAWADSIDWSDVFVVGHNLAGFDAMILSWRLGIKPRLWGCTLSMARPIHAKDAGGSLAALVKHYQLGVKDQTILHQTKGRHLSEFTAQERMDMKRYNSEDVEQMWRLFKVLLPLTPKDEMALIDMTIRMLVYPQFLVDLSLLRRGLKAERARKRKALLELSEHLEIVGLTDDDLAGQVQTLLMSAPKFVSLLESRGVTAPTKISPTTGKPAPALAKTDAAFLALQEHPDPVVALATSARLGVKSTILETRIAAFIETAEACAGKLPIPLRYYGADTTGRWSGEIFNAQNLPRIDPKKPKLSDVLRLSLMAPPRHQVVVADLSGIELRMNHFLWQVPSSMALFQADPEKADLYKEFAATLYKVPKDQVTKEQRQIGKLAHLGLQYGASHGTFRKVAKTMGGVDLSEHEAATVVTAWRDAYPEIVQGWARCQEGITHMVTGVPFKLDPWGLCTTVRHGIQLPRGLTIRYPALRQEWDEKDQRQAWVYGTGRHRVKIYSSKIGENVCQALSRIVMADIMLAYAKTPLGKQYPIAHCVHDELVVVAHQANAPEVLDTLQGLMRTPPEWFPELVTWSEGDIAQRYGKAK